MSRGPLRGGEPHEHLLFPLPQVMTFVNVWPLGVVHTTVIVLLPLEMVPLV